MGSYETINFVKKGSSEEDLIINDIIFTGQVLHKEGLVNAQAGNISVRNGDSVYITKTGAYLGYLTENDIVKVHLYKSSLIDTTASSELIVHREIYKSMPDINAVIHAHPVYAVSLTFKLDDYFCPIDNEGKMFLGSIPILEVEKASASLELAHNVRKTLKKEQKNFLLIKTHGSIAIGKNLKEALRWTSDMEFCAKVFTLANTF